MKLVKIACCMISKWNMNKLLKVIKVTKVIKMIKVIKSVNTTQISNILWKLL